LASDAGLRRAQALAGQSEIGLAMAKELISQKLVGQQRVALKYFQSSTAAFAIVAARTGSVLPRVRKTSFAVRLTGRKRIGRRGTSYRSYILALICRAFLSTGKSLAAACPQLTQAAISSILHGKGVRPQTMHVFRTGLALLES
jgi:hypothetical protein